MSTECTTVCMDSYSIVADEPFVVNWRSMGVGQPTDAVNVGVYRYPGTLPQTTRCDDELQSLNSEDMASNNGSTTLVVKSADEWVQDAIRTRLDLFVRVVRMSAGGANCLQGAPGVRILPSKLRAAPPSLIPSPIPTLQVSASESNRSLNSGQVAAIAAVCGALVALMMLGFFLFLYRRKKASKYGQRRDAPMLAPSPSETLQNTSGEFSDDGESFSRKSFILRSDQLPVSLGLGCRASVASHGQDTIRTPSALGMVHSIVVTEDAPPVPYLPDQFVVSTEAPFSNHPEPFTPVSVNASIDQDHEMDTPTISTTDAHIIGQHFKSHLQTDRTILESNAEH